MLVQRRCSFFTLAILVAALVPLTACLNFARADSECPFNGGFELSALGQPLGWDLDGAWLLRTDAACTGRNGICLRADCTRAGNRMVSQGYLLAGPGETLKISLNYMSATGGPSVGLVFCDAFGRSVGEGAFEALPAAAGWTNYERSVILAADSCSRPYSTVRVAFVADKDGVAAKLDDVCLAHAHPGVPAPDVPEFRAQDRPNLLTNPELAVAQDGTLPGWTPVCCDGYCKDAATAPPAAQAQTAQLCLKGGEQGAGWISDPVLLDGGLPYVLQVDLSDANVTAGQPSVLLRVLDPEDPSVVWLQQIVPVPAGQPAGPVALSLPRLFNDSAPLKAQVALLLPPVSAGTAVATAVALRPEALSMSVRACATAGGFKLPQDVSLFISAINNTYSALRPKAYMKVFDTNGDPVSQEARAIVIGSRSAAYFPYKPKLMGAGDYKLLVRIMAGGKDLGSCEYKFNVAGD
jgi:hypothetical protein